MIPIVDEAKDGLFLGTLPPANDAYASQDADATARYLEISDSSSLMYLKIRGSGLEPRTCVLHPALLVKLSTDLSLASRHVFQDDCEAAPASRRP